MCDRLCERLHFSPVTTVARRVLEVNICPPTYMKGKTHTHRDAQATKQGVIMGNNFIPKGDVRVIDHERLLSSAHII